MSNILSRSRAKLKLTLLAKGSQIQNVSVSEIPKIWSDFGTQGDQWINVEFPESVNSSGCIYVGLENSVFDPHVHQEAVEHLTVINPGGEVEIVTDKDVTTVEYPNSIVIDKGVPHSVIFKKKTRLLVMWHPRFDNGWNADFLKD